MLVISKSARPCREWAISTAAKLPENATQPRMGFTNELPRFQTKRSLANPSVLISLLRCQLHGVDLDGRARRIPRSGFPFEPRAEGIDGRDSTSRWLHPAHRAWCRDRSFRSAQSRSRRSLSDRRAIALGMVGFDL